jgi:hypothetical protein
MRQGGQVVQLDLLEIVLQDTCVLVAGECGRCGGGSVCVRVGWGVEMCAAAVRLSSCTFLKLPSRVRRSWLDGG